MTDLVSQSDAADLIGTDTAEIRRLIADGQLEAVRLFRAGSAWVRLDDLIRLTESGYHPPPASTDEE